MIFASEETTANAFRTACLPSASLAGPRIYPTMQRALGLFWSLTSSCFRAISATCALQLASAMCHLNDTDSHTHSDTTSRLCLCSMFIVASPNIFAIIISCWRVHRLLESMLVRAVTASVALKHMQACTSY